MNKLSIFFALLVMICSATSCDKVEALFSQKPKEEGVVGGYSKPRNLTDEEHELFNQTVKTLEGVEYKPMNVSTQIVAGVNYRFLCKARRIDESGKKGKRYYAAIVVHKPLVGQGEPRILSIEKQSR